MARAAYRLLGRRTFLTTGDKESRAWTFRAGAKAPECAGVIHSDLQRGFIRAEVIRWDELLAARLVGRRPRTPASCASRARTTRSSTATSSRSASTSEPDRPSATATRASGRVVVVATPIGNLGDLSPRAVDALASADYIYCEDTRRTLKLLNHAGITGPRLVSHHRHNEAATTPTAVARAKSGAAIALVTDAGTPLVSDPGSRLVRAALAEGIDVETVPGPSAALAALVVSGLSTDRFSFEGFVPRSGRERARAAGGGGGRGRPGRRHLRVPAPGAAHPRRPVGRMRP